MPRRTYTRTDSHNAHNSPGRKVCTSESMRRVVDLVVYQRRQKAPAEGFEDIDDVEFYILGGSRRTSPMRVILTNLREDELDVLAQVFNEAVELARPLIKERQRRDAKKFAAGGEPPISAYRDRAKVMHLSDTNPEVMDDLLSIAGDLEEPAEGESD
jgi:hypothetical protein